MEPQSRLNRFRWNLGARLCGGTTVELSAPDADGIVLRMCEKCGRTTLDVGAFRAFIRRPDQLPELLSQMESYLRKRGHEGEASEVRKFSTHIEVSV